MWVWQCVLKFEKGGNEQMSLKRGRNFNKIDVFASGSHLAQLSETDVAL